MPDYRILSDDRGWPMAYEIRPDGTLDDRAAGAFIGPRPVTQPITVNGILVPDATILVDWYSFDGPEPLVPLGWEIKSPAPPIARLQPGDRSIPLTLHARPATGMWCGPGRVQAATPFPFTAAEWRALTKSPQ